MVHAYHLADSLQPKSLAAPRSRPPNRRYPADFYHLDTGRGRIEK